MSDLPARIDAALGRPGPLKLVEFIALYTLKPKVAA